MTSRATVPASWSALFVPTIVAVAPKHVGVLADAGATWTADPRRTSTTAKRAAVFTSQAVSAKRRSKLEGDPRGASSRMAVPETWLSGRKQPPAKRLGG